MKRVGSGGTSSGSSARTRRGVIRTINSVCSARSALDLKSGPMIGSLLRIGIADLVFLRQIVEQPGNRERLAVAQLDVGLGPARRERRNPETTQADAVGEVERADFGLDLEPDRVAGDRRLEVQSDAELLELDGHGACRALHDRHRELAAGQEARFLTVIGDQVRFREALKRAVLLEGPQEGANPC